MPSQPTESKYGLWIGIAVIVIIVILFAAGAILTGGKNAKLAPPPVEAVVNLTPLTDAGFPGPKIVPLIDERNHEENGIANEPDNAIDPLTRRLFDSASRQSFQQGTPAPNASVIVGTISTQSEHVLAQTQWSTYWSNSTFPFPQEGWLHESRRFAALYHAAHDSSFEAPQCIKRWHEDVIKLLLNSIFAHLRGWFQMRSQNLTLAAVNTPTYLQEPPWSKTLYVDPRAAKLNRLMTQIITKGFVADNVVDELIKELKSFYAIKTEEEKRGVTFLEWCEALNALEKGMNVNKAGTSNALRRYLILCSWYESVRDVLIPGHHLAKHFVIERHIMVTVHEILYSVVARIVTESCDPTVFSSTALQDALSSDLLSVLQQPL